MRIPCIISIFVGIVFSASGLQAQSTPQIDSIILPADCQVMAAGPRPARCVFVTPKTPFNFKRTALEFGGLYTGVVLFYFRDGRVRRIDRGFAEGLKTILSPSRIRFDANLYNMNNVAHPIGGLMYYGFPRANGATATGSFLTLLGASVFWEQVVELQEIASINDHIGTVHSGWALGEATYQARSLFRRGRPAAANRLMSGILGIPMTFTEPVRRRAALERASTFDGFLPADLDHTAQVYLGMSHRDSPDRFLSGGHIEVGLETETFNAGRRDAVDDRAGWLSGTTATQFTLGFSIQDSKLNEVRTTAKVLPAGWYRHRVEQSPAGPSGHSILIGPSGEFELDMLGDDQQLYMQRIAAYMLGATLDAELVRPGLRMRGVLDVYANYAQAGSLGRVDHPDYYRAGESSPFLVNGYYNAFGPSLAARGSVRWRAVQLQAQARLHRLSSIETTKLDANPDSAIAIRDKTDRWTTLSGGISVRPHRHMEVSLQHQRRVWMGTIEDFRVDVVERGWWLRTGVLF